MTIVIHQHAEGLVPGPGFYEMSAELYHSDPAPQPSLSASTAVKLLDETPLHAWHGHPRLNPAYEREDGNAAMSKGSVAHELILGKGGGFEALDFADWRTNAAKAARETAVQAGRVPILKVAYDEATMIAAGVCQAILEIEDCSDFFHADARSELVMIWQEGDVWCRSMIDRLTPRGIIYDIKTGGRGIDSLTLERKFNDSFEIQPSFYLRGLHALWPEMAGRFKWRWAFCENVAPFAVRVEEADATVFGLGQDRVDRALRMWRRCLKANRWPGYAAKVGRLGPPQYVFNRRMEQVAAPSVNAPHIPEEITP